MKRWLRNKIFLKNVDKIVKIFLLVNGCFDIYLYLLSHK